MRTHKRSGLHTNAGLEGLNSSTTQDLHNARVRLSNRGLDWLLWHMMAVVELRYRNRQIVQHTGFASNTYRTKHIDAAIALVSPISLS